MVRQQAHTYYPSGLDAPTTAREQGLQPYGALTLFFRWRKKSVQKKASGTATPGKRLLLPILTAGLAMSRAMELDSLHTGAERARARLFPPSKWAGLFPSAAYRRPAPAQLAGDILNPCRVGCFGVACVFLQGKMPALNQIHAGIFCEPEGLSPDGGLFYSTNRKSYQTGEPWHPSCHGVKTPAKQLFLEYSRAPWARCGV